MDGPDYGALAEAGVELVKLILDQALSAKLASAEQHQAVLDRYAAARAALAGEKSAAHQAIEADLAATLSQLEALQMQRRGG